MSTADCILKNKRNVSIAEWVLASLLGIGEPCFELPFNCNENYVLFDRCATSALQRTFSSSAVRLHDTKESATTSDESSTFRWVKSAWSLQSLTQFSNIAFYEILKSLFGFYYFSQLPPLPGQDSPLRWAGKPFEELAIVHIKATYNKWVFSFKLTVIPIRISLTAPFYSCKKLILYPTECQCIQNITS